MSPLSATFGDAVSSIPGLTGENIDVTTYTFGFSAQQNIWDFGRSLAINRQASLNEELSKIRFEKKKTEISFNIKKAYYGLLQAKAMEKVTLLTLKEIENLKESVKERKKQGMATVVDVLNAESEYARFKLETSKANHAVELAMSSLLNTMGEKMDAQADIQEENFPLPEEFPLGFKSFDECKIIALAQKLDLKESEVQKQVTEALLSYASSDWWPSIGANAGYNWTDNKFFPEKPSWNVGLSISLPLFKGFSRLAKVEAADYDAKSASAGKDSVTQAVIIMAKNNYFKALEGKESFDASVKKEDYLKNNFESINAKYNEGLATITDLIEAQTKKANTELEKQQLLYNYHLSLSELEYSIGGLK